MGTARWTFPRNVHKLSRACLLVLSCTLLCATTTTNAIRQHNRIESLGNESDYHRRNPPISPHESVQYPATDPVFRAAGDRKSSRFIGPPKNHYHANFGSPRGISVEGVSTFGTALKGIGLSPGNETELFSRAGNGTITMMWFTGQLWWLKFGDTRIRIYVDGETTPSIDYPLYLGHGIGFGNPVAPWGTETVGKLAVGGGIYNTFRLPFGNGIRITATLAEGVTKSESFYFMCKGLTNYPVILKGSYLQLPPTARLRLHTVQAQLKPIEKASLLNVTGSGALLMVIQKVESENARCLEGKHQATIDGEAVQLSSGFEDYYLSAQYFDAGEFRTTHSGMTSEDRLLFPQKLSAYRNHESDPVLWRQGMDFTWDNGEHTSGPLAAGNTNLTALVWYYTY